MIPEISIVVPVYNVEKYLEQCLDSILAQTFENFEVILVNDGSTDSSGEICDRYTELDKRVKVYHKKNEGVSSARNMGVEKSKGKYLIFIDSDDYITANYCKVLKDFIEELDVDIAVCRMAREIPRIENLSNYSKTIFPREKSLIQMFRGKLYRFSLSGKMYKTDFVKRYKFPKGMIHEDMATTYKYFLEAKNIAYIDYVGYVYFYRENSILTKKYNAKRLDAFIHWKEILELTKDESENLLKEIYKRYLHWIVDNIFYILSSDEKKDKKLEYLLFIKKHLKNRKKIFSTNKQNLKYITILFLLLFNPRLLFFKGER
ncbi:MAG: glycosyltransferase family 2 protein [Cetobacterium sp.]|uniref:glycosyltransferase family 2 protein n=1 Tax=Cetobacterium sp. TaxID=2071632 RepID=UPI003F2AA836